MVFGAPQRGLGPKLGNQCSHPLKYMRCRLKLKTVDVRLIPLSHVC